LNQFKEDDRVFFKPLGEGTIFKIIPYRTPTNPYCIHVIFDVWYPLGEKHRSRHWVFTYDGYYEDEMDITLIDLKSFYVPNPDYFICKLEKI
jgi:hypothetical protein